MASHRHPAETEIASTQACSHGGNSPTLAARRRMMNSLHYQLGGAGHRASEAGRVKLFPQYRHFLNFFRSIVTFPRGQRPESA